MKSEKDYEIPEYMAEWDYFTSLLVGFDKAEVLKACRNLKTFPYEPRRVLDIPLEDGEIGIEDAVTCAVAQTESLYYNHSVAFLITQDIKDETTRERCEERMTYFHNIYR